LLAAIYGLQSVFLNPIRNGRFMPPEAAADLLEGQSTREEKFQRSPIDGPIFHRA